MYYFRTLCGGERIQDKITVIIGVFDIKNGLNHKSKDMCGEQKTERKINKEDLMYPIVEV